MKANWRDHLHNRGTNRLLLDLENSIGGRNETDDAPALSHEIEESPRKSPADPDLDIQIRYGYGKSRTPESSSGMGGRLGRDIGTRGGNQF